MSNVEIKYLPAIAMVDGKPDYFWSDATRPYSAIDTLLIHGMSNSNMKGEAQFDVLACLELLNSLGLSTHIWIDRLGCIYQSVDYARMAWHAGKSMMPDPDLRTRVNAFSVGVELIGSKNVPFEDEQYDALVEYTGELMQELPIRNILGHKDVASAEVRKLPGEEPKEDPWGFNWTIYLALLESKIGEENFGRLELKGSNLK